MSIYYIPFVFVGLIIIVSAFFIVKQQTAAIVERFGKFQGVRHAGLQLKIPLVDRISGRLSLKIQQLDVIIETKTFTQSVNHYFGFKIWFFWIYLGFAICILNF